jgi:hypothetical protein
MPGTRVTCWLSPMPVQSVICSMFLQLPDGCALKQLACPTSRGAEGCYYPMYMWT